MSLRRVLPSAFFLLLLAACQAPVRPDPADLPEPVATLPPPGAAVPAPAPAPEPEAPAAPDPIDTGAEVFDRLVARLDDPACVKGIHNTSWRRRYAGYPERFAHQLEAILPLLGYVVEEVERRGLPGEFALIPIVESWYRPEAIGPGGPAGMWQMIASTARNHGVRIQPGYDGRLNPLESTDAALGYLETLAPMFGGEWRATAMAYNAGEYRILRAFNAAGDRRVSGERHLPRGLSRTTYDYVAKLHALACLLARPERHGLVLPREARFVPLQRATLPAHVASLEQAAGLLGTDASALLRLNPAYRGGRVVAGATRGLLAPATPLAQLRAASGADADAGATATGDDPPADEPRRHQIQRGDTLSRIAARYGVPLRQLFELNGMDGRSVLHPGRWLRIDP